AGLYDVTITGTDPFPDRPEHEAPDPTLMGIGPAYTAAVNRQLRSEIGVRTDREYRLLSLEVNKAWKEDTERHFFAPPEGATDSFRYGMALSQPQLEAPPAKPTAPSGNFGGRGRARLGSDLLLRLCVVAVAQVAQHVRNVRELLLEVALEGLQALDQLGAARERAAKEHPRATTPTMGMT